MGFTDLLSDAGLTGMYSNCVWLACESRHPALLECSSQQLVEHSLLHHQVSLLQLGLFEVPLSAHFRLPGLSVHSVLLLGLQTHTLSMLPNWWTFLVSLETCR
jgi:hypothetical protein